MKVALEVDSGILDNSFESLRHRFRQVRGGRPGSPEEMAAHLCPSSWTFAAKYWSSSADQFLSLSLTNGFRISLYLFAHWSSFRPSMRSAITYQHHTGFGLAHRLTDILPSGSQPLMSRKQQLILFFRPTTLSQSRIQRVKPTFSTVLPTLSPTLMPGDGLD